MSDPKREHATSTSENRDPITGEPGAHPVGTGIGAVAGAAAAGAAAGAAGGPVGAVVGAVAGGIVGGLAGKSIAESIDPTAEDAYWRENHASRPYYEPSTTYDEDLAPAYRHGWESRARYADRSFDEVEPDLGRDWDSVKSGSRLNWDRAKHATRDAWDRIEHSVTGQHADKR
jgi:hypothetical protein